jgi:hypothetical protein
MSLQLLSPLLLWALLGCQRSPLLPPQPLPLL